MISISNCPISGLQRKVDYEFFWYKRSRQIIIQCYVDYYKDGVVATANITRLKPYKRPLVASDTLVNSQTGVIMTQQEIDNYYQATALLNAYNSELEMYNNALPAYTAAVLQYNEDLLVYQTALDEYNEAMSLSPANPLNLPFPIAPIPPTELVQPMEPSPLPVPGPAPIQEYDFYAYVLGVQPLILPQMIEDIILLRDSEGKFDI